MLLRVLAAYASASRAWLLEKCHAQNCITMATAANGDGSAAAASGGRVSVAERKELCVALTAAQESGLVQLLLEMCLQSEEEEEEEEEVGFVYWAVCLISHTHTLTLSVESWQPFLSTERGSMPHLLLLTPGTVSYTIHTHITNIDASQHSHLVTYTSSTVQCLVYKYRHVPYIIL